MPPERPEVVSTPLRALANQSEPIPSPRGSGHRRSQTSTSSGLAASACFDALLHHRHGILHRDARWREDDWLRSTTLLSGPTGREGERAVANVFRDRLRSPPRRPCRYALRHGLVVPENPVHRRSAGRWLMSLNMTSVAGRPLRCSMRVRAALALSRPSQRCGGISSACRMSQAIG
jgi:hypothetical protein